MKNNETLIQRETPDERMKRIEREVEEIREAARKKTELWNSLIKNGKTRALFSTQPAD